MYHGVNSIYVRKTPRLSLSKTPDLVRSSRGENFARTTFKRFGARCCTIRSDTYVGGIFSTVRAPLLPLDPLFESYNAL